MSVGSLRRLNGAVDVAFLPKPARSEPRDARRDARRSSTYILGPPKSGKSTILNRIMLSKDFEAGPGFAAQYGFRTGQTAGARTLRSPHCALSQVSRRTLRGEPI